MPTAPNSLTMTAVSAKPGQANTRASSVVFPLPRKPVSTEIGSRLGGRGGAGRCMVRSIPSYARVVGNPGRHRYQRGPTLGQVSEAVFDRSHCINWLDRVIRDPCGFPNRRTGDLA